MKYCYLVITAIICLSVTAHAADDAKLPEIMNAAQPQKNLLIGGQPTMEELRQARDAGVEAVLNLRGEGEFTDWDQAAVVDELGMTYIHIPVAGAADLDETTVRRFDKALQQLDHGPMLMHCASGNRVGALFALRAGLLQDEDVESAIAIGRAHGLTGLEPVVRARLENR